MKISAVTLLWTVVLGVALGNGGGDAGSVMAQATAGDSAFVPVPDEFVPCDRYPVMIHEEQPKYPREAVDKGLEGIVWVKSLVDSTGVPQQAKVGKSSGAAALDSAAVQAAYKCRFKPGMYKDRPIAVWVMYRVAFALTSTKF